MTFANVRRDRQLLTGVGINRPRAASHCLRHREWFRRARQCRPHGVLAASAFTAKRAIGRIGVPTRIPNFVDVEPRDERYTRESRTRRGLASSGAAGDHAAGQAGRPIQGTSSLSATSRHAPLPTREDQLITRDTARPKCSMGTTRKRAHRRDFEHACLLSQPDARTPPPAHHTHCGNRPCQPLQVHVDGVSPVLSRCARMARGRRYTPDRTANALGIRSIPNFVDERVYGQA